MLGRGGVGASERGRLCPRDKVCSREKANLTKLRLESLAAKWGGRAGKIGSFLSPSFVHIGDLEGGLAEWPKVAEGGRESGRAKHGGSREMRNCLLRVAFVLVLPVTQSEFDLKVR